MNRTDQSERSSSQKLATILVLLVLVAFATTQVVHSHALSKLRSNESHCSLCLATHSVAAPAQASASIIVFYALFIEAAPEPQLHARLSVSSSFIRPPPASL